MNKKEENSTTIKHKGFVMVDSATYECFSYIFDTKDEAEECIKTQELKDTFVGNIEWEDNYE